MKSVLFALCSLFAASGYAQFTPGIEAGFGSSGFNQHNHLLSDYGFTPHSVSTFHVGFTADYAAGKRWLLLSDLLYSGGGGRLDGMGIPLVYPYTAQTILHLQSLRLALSGAVRFVKVGRFSLFAGPGFFAARGLAGKANGFTNGRIPGTIVINPGSPPPFSFNNSVDFTSDHSGAEFPQSVQVNPWDAGYMLLAGADWREWRVKATYSHGLERQYSQYGYDFRSEAFSVTAEWTWRRKHKGQ